MNKLNLMASVYSSLSSSAKITFFVPQNPSFDKMAAALSLYLCFKKQGKEVGIVCSSAMTVAFSRLVGVNKVKTQIGGRNLVVSFQYLEDAIDKVSYKIENEKFNLVIQPKPGAAPLSTEEIKFSYSGSFGKIVIVGALSLETLGDLYHKEKNLFTKEAIVNIDINPKNQLFGNDNLINDQASSYSEVVAQFLKNNKAQVNKDISGNLLLGIQKATVNFTLPKVTPEAFEAAAFCLRGGAKMLPFFAGSQNRQVSSSFSPPGLPGSGNKMMGVTKSGPSQFGPLPKPVQAGNQIPPADWYRPKVFKGSTKLG
ncbi:bifunctional oligoribonuclease/PAP phosphatase NrnA [Patescibacteria group bacterium]